MTKQGFLVIIFQPENKPRIPGNGKGMVEPQDRDLCSFFIPAQIWFRIEGGGKNVSGKKKKKIHVPKGIDARCILVCDRTIPDHIPGPEKTKICVVS